MELNNFFLKKYNKDRFLPNQRVIKYTIKKANELFSSNNTYVKLLKACDNELKLNPENTEIKQLKKLFDKTYGIKFITSNSTLMQEVKLIDSESNSLLPKNNFRKNLAKRTSISTEVYLKKQEKANLFSKNSSYADYLYKFDIIESETKLTDIINKIDES